MPNEEAALRYMLSKIEMPLDVQPLEILVYTKVDRDSAGGNQKIRLLF